MTISEPGEVCGFSLYMGFGRLDIDSIVSTEDRARATYSLDGDLVYTVEREHEEYLITEFYEGKALSSSRDKSLMTAFFHLVAAVNPPDNPRFFKLGMNTTHAGNVHFVWPTNKSGFLTYPAGFCFTLRQPVGGSNRQAWEQLRRDIARVGPAHPLDFKSETPGAIFRLHRDWTVSREEVSLVELSVRLLDLTETVSLCQRRGLIPPGKEYRMEIWSLGNQLESTNLFPGELKRGIRAYSVFEFGTETAQVPAEQADERFAEMAKEYATSNRRIPVESADRRKLK